MDELLSGLGEILRSPDAEGSVEMIVRRPGVDAREVLHEGTFDERVGLIGDSWQVRPSSRTPNGTPHPDMQINIMNARVISLLAGARDRWPLAGDQLFVDLDLSGVNLPPGTRLEAGTVVFEVTPLPHTGCLKFVSRFGVDGMKFVNSTEGRRLNLRGINARVVQGGTVKTGDRIRKIARG
jgi:hypothetical protein